MSLPLRANLPLAADVTVASARPLDRLRWRLVRAYMHADLPAWGRLYAWAGGNDAERWRHAPTAVMRHEAGRRAGDQCRSRPWGWY